MGERAETQQRVFSDASQEKPWLAMLLLLKPQLNLNTTSTVVGFDMKMTVQTPPHPPTTTETQWYLLGGSDEHLLITARYELISKKK